VQTPTIPRGITPFPPSSWLKYAPIIIKVRLLLSSWVTVQAVSRGIQSADGSGAADAIEAADDAAAAADAPSSTPSGRHFEAANLEAAAAAAGFTTRVVEIGVDAGGGALL
jgi:hypothetical protein